MLLSIKKFTMSKITRKCTSEKDSPWTVIAVYTGLIIQNILKLLTLIIIKGWNVV